MKPPWDKWLDHSTTPPTLALRDRDVFQQVVFDNRDQNREHFPFFVIHEDILFEVYFREGDNRIYAKKVFEHEPTN